MKKLLIATTALVGTASVAAADITFSGYGRFGIQYDENRTTGGGIKTDSKGNLVFKRSAPFTYTDETGEVPVDVTVTGSGETTDPFYGTSGAVLSPRDVIGDDGPDGTADTLQIFVPVDSDGASQTGGNGVPVFKTNDYDELVLDSEDQPTLIGNLVDRDFVEDDTGTPLYPAGAITGIAQEKTKKAEETRLEERFRLNIDASTETDGGVRFAVRIRAQSDDTVDGRAGDLSWNAPRFQVGVGGFRVRVGNISGVTDAAEVVDTFGYEPGLTGKTGHYATFGGFVLDAYDTYDSNSGDNGNTGINVKYEAGPFAVMGSWSPDFDKNDPNANRSFADKYDDRMTWEVGASYTWENWTFGAVYGHGDYNLDGIEVLPVYACSCDSVAANDGVGSTYSIDSEYNWWAITASGSVGPADIALFIGNTDLDSDLETLLDYDDKVAYGISGSYPIGAATNIVASIAGGGAKSLDTAYGIGFDHSLGGGVTLKGMGGQDAFGNTIADLGVIFNF